MPSGLCGRDPALKENFTRCQLIAISSIAMGSRVLMEFRSCVPSGPRGRDPALNETCTRLQLVDFIDPSMLVGWLAGWLASWLAGWVAGWLAGWLLAAG